MSIFSPSHHSTRPPTSPAYALPTRLPSRVNSNTPASASASNSPAQLRSRTTTAASSHASPSTSRIERSPTATRNGSAAGTPNSALQRRSTYQQPLGTGGSVRRGEGTGRALKRSIGCDVVLDTSRRHQTTLYDFIQTLGTPIEPPLAADSKRRAQTPRPGTPAREPRLDLPAVRQNLRELYETEKSYLRKMQAMQEHLARPLRTFAGSSATAIISKEAAKLLFGNIEELVPIAVQFERDLAGLVRELDDIYAHDRTSHQMPRNMGQIILNNVERMRPFRTWLMNAGESDSAFRALERNGQFHTYLNRQIMTVRQQAQSTGGLQELLAEPFQRISRYRLMIDPIIRHLPQSDPNIPALQEAVDKLSEVCSMETDEGTKRTAEMWALMHTIQGFPSALVAYRSRQFLGCVDADEIVDSPTGSYDLRCCIFLFSDKLVLAKRPPGTKGARQLTGIDNNDSLVQQFKAAQRPQAEVSLLAAGTPRKNDGGKIKKDAMGFRGAVELLEVRAVDLGPAEFGLVFEQPPADQNERWRGRPTRRYQIASSCGFEDRVAEKRSWLAKVEEAQAQRRISFGAPGVRRSAPVPASGEGSSGEQKETVVYWTVWDRDSWEDAGKAAKAQLALHIDEDGDAHDLTLGRPGGGPPQIVARASFVGGDGCRFSVRSTSATPSQAERISLDRITPAIAEIGLSYGLCSFPARTAPDSPTTNRPRPRSFLNSSINGALDFIGAGSLKRGDSKTSRVSSATTTSRYTGFSNSLSSATAFSPRQLIGKKSAPELYGSSRHRASKSVSALGNGLSMDEEDEDRLEQSTARPYGLPTRAETEPPADMVPTGSIAKRPTRHRRSLSMPQQPTLDALAAPEPVEEEPETDPLRPPSPEPLADSRPHTAMSWLPEDEPMAQVQTSPIAYRAPSKNGRRLMGPRAPGATPSSATRQSDYGSPFDRRREESPAPAGDREDYSPAPETPSKAEEDQFIDRPASAGYKRTGAEAMSPRKSPAKKASVYGADGSAFGTPARGLSGVSPLSITRRAPSSGVRLPSGRVRIPSDGSARRRASRIASGASTVRAGSPTPLAEGEEGEDRMDEDREVEGPVTRLKEHVKALKGALVQDGVGKENTGLSHRPTLSRSPHTRDVHLKMTNKSSSYTAAFSAAKARTPSSTAGADSAFLLRWTEELNSLVDECADLAQQPSATLPSGPSLTEMLTLEAERDVLQAELASCQSQVAALSSANSTLQSDLATTQAQLSEQQNLYSHALKMIDNVQLLWDELDQIDAEGAAIDHPVAKLQARAAREMKARTEAEHKLGMMELERAKERAKVERYEAVLREHGLI